MTADELHAMMTTDDWHWWLPGRRRILRATLACLELASPCRILDGGCGSARVEARTTGREAKPGATDFDIRGAGAQ